VADIEERHMRARTKTLISLLAPALIVWSVGWWIYGDCDPAADFPDEPGRSLMRIVNR